MILDHYKERGAVLAADVVNTRGSISGREFMEDEAALERWFRDQGFGPGSSLGPDDVAAFRRLRDRLHAIFFAPDDELTADLLNGALADAGPVPQLVGADGRWQVEFSPSSGGAVQDLAAVTSVGLAALFASSGRSRFGICSADDCRDVYIDTSKNRSRRYCDDSCSSRTNVAAYRARQRST